MYKSLYVNHIVAMAENRIIGREGGMPWHIAEDFKFFKRTTMNCPVVMGRKTWESIGRPLPGRQMIVVSRQTIKDLPKEVFAAKSVDEAFELCIANKNSWGSNIFVIGGGELYRQTLDVCDKIYLTLVHKVVEGDTSYPEFSSESFKEVSSAGGQNQDPMVSFKIFESFKSKECLNELAF